MNLYSILDLGYVNENQVVDCATSICRSGVVKLQLRAKSIEPKKIFNLAKMVKPICNDYSIPLIINDYPEIAASIGADGVHIGQEDGEIKKVRAIIGDNKIVGSLSSTPIIALSRSPSLLKLPAPQFSTPTILNLLFDELINRDSFNKSSNPISL